VQHPDIIPVPLTAVDRPPHIVDAPLEAVHINRAAFGAARRASSDRIRADSMMKEEGVARAYVKVNVAAGREREVRDALLAREEVQSADLTSGDQDIIALVEAKSFDELLDLTLNQLRTIDGVTGTVTNLVIDKDEEPPQIG